MTQGLHDEDPYHQMHPFPRIKAILGYFNMQTEISRVPEQGADYFIFYTEFGSSTIRAQERKEKIRAREYGKGISCWIKEKYIDKSTTTIEIHSTKQTSLLK